MEIVFDKRQLFSTATLTVPQKTFNVKSELINTTQAREKEKSESLTGVQPMTMFMSC